MGWIWKEDDDVESAAAGDNSTTVLSSNKDGCFTRKIVSSQCRTEEMEPGIFIRKCENTQQIFRHCLGRPSELVESNKKYTEEDVTDQMTKGSFRLESSDPRPLDFPGLCSDIDVIERSLFRGFNRFLEAAEEMSNEFLNVFGSPHNKDDGSFLSNRRGIQIEDFPAKVPEHKNSEMELDHSDGDVDISGLARDV